MRREISYSFIFEVCLQLLEDPMLDASEILVVCVSRKSFLNKGCEYGRLSRTTIAEFYGLY